MERCKALIHLGLEIREIRQSPLPELLRSQVWRAWLSLNTGNRGQLPNPIRILGREISYFKPFQLRLLFREIFMEQSYCFQSTTPDPVIVDCGSNIGMSILYFKMLYPAARITGIEADPAAFDKLTLNVGSHLSSPGVVLHHCALCDVDGGEIDFYRSDADSLRMSVNSQRTDGDRIAVPARRLSSFLTDEVDLLKIDVEGAEGMVFRELIESGQIRLIKQIHLEYHHHIDGAVDNLSAMLQLLEGAGYGYQLFTQGRRRMTPRSFQDVSIYAYRK